MMGVAMPPLRPADRDAFVRRFGHVFEHSAWVVERAWRLAPPETLAALCAAFEVVLASATPQERLTLLRAHPRLADKLAIQQGLTAESTAEQASAGLDRLSPKEFATFLELNQRYEARFGFPFIICARLHTKTEIIAALHARLDGAPEVELREALSQVSKISRLRLEDVLRTNPR